MSWILSSNRNRAWYDKARIDYLCIGLATIYVYIVAGYIEWSVVVAAVVVVVVVPVLLLLLVALLLLPLPLLLLLFCCILNHSSC